MKKLFFFGTSLIIAALIFCPFQPNFKLHARSEKIERKIVVFQSKLDKLKREEIIKEVGGVKIKNLDLIEGMAVYLPSKWAEKVLKTKEGILRIDDDIEVFTLSKKTLNSKPQPIEILPWGIDKIEAERVWGGKEDAIQICEGCITGKTIKVAILDTGIDFYHPDLKANIKGGINTISLKRSYYDDNGHGTHVAGIVAAIENEIGVIGAAPEVELYAVKVLNSAGRGFLSDVIEGLNWVIEQKNKQGGEWVINMSFGTSQYNTSFEEAINKVYEAGITQVAAAGNSGPGENSVLYPAKFDKVIAVSAIDENNYIASFSSRGPEIDLAAPGVNIYSTYKGASYKTLSGTSMAAPHVTGTIALLLSKPEKCDLNQDGKCSVEEVENKLKSTALNLGDSNLYGAGLVNAEEALK